MIVYSDSVEGLSAGQLGGFFVGWPRPPSADTHLRLLGGSSHAWIAMDDETQRVVGFVTALTDSVLAAHIPLLEVLPAYRGRGIGSELIRRMLDTLSPIYAVDVVCDDDVRPFYERLDFRPCGAMVRRDYAQQSGA